MRRLLAALLSLVAVVTVAGFAWTTTHRASGHAHKDSTRHQAVWPGPTAPPNSALPSDAARARTSYEALQQYFGTSDGSDLYRVRYPVEATDTRYSYEWPFSQVHVALLDLAGLPGHLGASYDAALGKADEGQMHYWANLAPGGQPGFEATAGVPYGTGGELYYDDNGWAGLEEAQAYAQTRSPRNLQVAERVFAVEVSGWDTDLTQAHAGGVYWNQRRTDGMRNTVSTMPAAELGLRLYQATKQARYLAWAYRMYQWTRANLQSPSGLYYDHISGDGATDESIWSYNQGTAIRVNQLLYDVTHNPKYLNEAERIASAAYSYFIVGRQLADQPLVYNAVLFRDMLALEAVTGGTQYRDAAQSYADWLWTSCRNPETGLYQDPSRPRAYVLDQAAVVQINATLAWPRSDLAKMT